MAEVLVKTGAMPAWASLQTRLSEQPVLTYLLTLGLVTLVFFLLHVSLKDMLGQQTLYLFMIPPVLLAGIVAGLGPGLAATAYAIFLQIFVGGYGNSCWAA